MNVKEVTKFLAKRDRKRKEDLEVKRKAILKKTISTLKAILSNTDIEVYLVGSIIMPYKFRKDSDIDIVIKDYKGDRLSLWSLLDEKLKRNVDLIIFEKCGFKEEIKKYGLKVI